MAKEKVTLRLKGVRPNGSKHDAGVAFKYENHDSYSLDGSPMSKREYIFSLRQALVALYKHELQKLQMFGGHDGAVETECRMFDMELRIEEKHD